MMMMTTMIQAVLDCDSVYVICMHVCNIYSLVVCSKLDVQDHDS